MERSCLYECRVSHRRLSPRPHRFAYRIFLFALDLAELDALSQRVRGFGRNRRALYEFRDADHLSPGPGTVREKLERYLAEQGVPLPADARVLLVTLPRVVGYIFNPVSFYFCETAAGQPLGRVVQVGNTFGEMKLYYVPNPEGAAYTRGVSAKHFYVSPFSPLDTHFDFRLRTPGERLAIHIHNSRGGQPTLVSALQGSRAPLTSLRLAWFTLKYPLVTLKVITLIHWHALRLWMKRVPWFAKAHQPELQRGVLRPHASLSGKAV